MKIYEKPSVEIKKFDVEDVITASVVETITGVDSTLETITGVTGAQGVVFEW